VVTSNHEGDFKVHQVVSLFSAAGGVIVEIASVSTDKIQTAFAAPGFSFPDSWNGKRGYPYLGERIDIETIIFAIVKSGDIKCREL